MRAWLLAAMTVVVVFSGCVGSDSKDEDAGKEGDDFEQPRVDVDSPYGAISGMVTGTEGLPIADAEVGIRDTDKVTRTSEGGNFAFEDLDPALYTIDVARIGYASAAREVEVVAGEVSDIELTLEAVAISKATYSATTHFVGNYDCAMGAVVWISACTYPYTAAYLAARDGYCDPAGQGVCAPPIANLSDYGLPEDLQENGFRYNFTVDPGAVEVVSEMEWVSTSAASNRMLLVMSCGDYDPILDDCSPHYGPGNGVEGTSPLRILWSASEIETKPGWVMARGYLPFFDPQVALSQRFDIWNTVFYNGPAPGDFTILEGSG